MVNIKHLAFWLVVNEIYKKSCYNQGKITILCRSSLYLGIQVRQRVSQIVIVESKIAAAASVTVYSNVTHKKDQISNSEVNNNMGSAVVYLGSTVKVR